MTEPQRRKRLRLLLEDLVEDLDVPDSKYEDAEQHYKAVGHWLNDEGSELVRYQPRIYAQGSFALGTAVKPLYDDDYDVDAVCLLEANWTELTQEELKRIVGKRLKANELYARMLDPKEGGRRCWTIKYAESSRFHLDVLPAIPDSPRPLTALGIAMSIARHAIRITDNETWGHGSTWPRSNPQGFVEWFKSRMQVAYERRRQAFLTRNLRAEVQNIPEYQIRTPLQRVIQLFKRHRDLRYHGDDDKPISIIITTLAALAYNNEDDLGEALLNVVAGLRRGIVEQEDGTIWIANPTNPAENFADKWKEEPRKREIFFEWLDTLERDHRAISDAITGNVDSIPRVAEVLAETYGAESSQIAVEKYARRTDADGLLVLARRPVRPFLVPHRRRPQWPVDPKYHVSITGQAMRDGFRARTIRSSDVLRKRISLEFEATTNVPKPYKVFWQVVNTGAEAYRRNGLRGCFYPGRLREGHLAEESTLYTGTHWIECFIVKNDVCVAKSGEFVVRIE